MKIIDTSTVIKTWGHGQGDPFHGGGYINGEQSETVPVNQSIVESYDDIMSIPWIIAKVPEGAKIEVDHSAIRDIFVYGSINGGKRELIATGIKDMEEQWRDINELIDAPMKPMNPSDSQSSVGFP